MTPKSNKVPGAIFYLRFDVEWSCEGRGELTNGQMVASFGA